MRTAVLTALPKAHAGMPYGSELVDGAVLELVEQGANDFDTTVGLGIGVELELRHKALDAVLRDLPWRSACELGAGLSPRGLAMATLGAYYEVDLEPMVALKAKLYRGLNPNIVRPELIACDLSSPTELVRWLSATTLEPPTAFVSEGLWWYLDWSEKEALGRTIFDFLSGTEGFLATTDCPSLLEGHPLQSDPARSAVSRTAGEHIRRYKFPNASNFAAYFEKLGFDVELIQPSTLCLSSCIGDARGYDATQIRERIDSYCSIAILRAEK